MKKNIYVLLLGAQSILCADLPSKVFIYLYTQATGKKTITLSEASLQDTIDQAHARCSAEKKGITPQKQAALDAALQKEINRPLPDISTVVQLLGNGANPNAKNRKQESIFIQSLANNNPDQVTLALIKAGADIQVYRPDDRMTPLMFAIRHGNRMVIDELLYEQADVTAQTKFEKTTPLMMAAQNCDTQTTEKLLKHGAASTINYQDNGGNTALMWAVKNLPQCRDQETMISLLLKAGADKSLVNHEGQTALQLLGIAYTKARKLLDPYDSPEAHGG